jgi:hypothetical protein
MKKKGKEKQQKISKKRPERSGGRNNKRERKNEA